jgi:hypothetical protein
VDGLPCKMLVRTYAYYLSPHLKTRKEYDLFNTQFEIIRKNMIKGIFVEEMVNDSHPNAISGPVDVNNLILKILKNNIL